jgi:hypothetical protein
MDPDPGGPEASGSWSATLKETKYRMFAPYELPMDWHRYGT